MAPYSESVYYGGRLEVWSSEWEVTWANDHPRTVNGRPDLRYSYTGRRFTRSQLIALADALPRAWTAAVEAAAALGSAAGQFSRPAPGGPITIEVTAGRPMVVIRDLRRLSSEADMASATQALRELIEYADAKQVEVKKLFAVR